jgi:hypothetical protein
MDDLDRLLTDALHDAASHAPSDAGLLGTVKERSRRQRRRRAALGAAAGAALLAAGIPFVAVLAAGPRPSAPPSSPSVNSTALGLVAGYSAPALPPWDWWPATPRRPSRTPSRRPTACGPRSPRWPTAT